MSGTTITSMKLQEQNWNEWRIYIRGRLMTKGLLSYIDKPTSNMNHDQTIADQKAHGLIIESLESDQYQWIEDAPTAYAAFKGLRLHHEPHSNSARVALLSEYGTMQWNTKQETLSAYLQRFKTITRKLYQLNVREPEDVTVSKLLATMPWSLRGVTLQISVTPADRQSVTATCLLLEEEYKQAIRQGEIKPPSGSSNDERALQALAKNSHRISPIYLQGQEKAYNMHYCKKLGHTADVCRKKASDESSSTDAGNAASTPSDTYFFLAHSTNQIAEYNQDLALHVNASALKTN